MTLKIALDIISLLISYAGVGAVCYFIGMTRSHKAAFRRGLHVGLEGATDLLSDIKKEMGDGAYLFLNAIDRSSLKSMEQARKLGMNIPEGLEKELKERLAKRDGQSCSPTSH